MSGGDGVLILCGILFVPFLFFAVAAWFDPYT